MRLLRTVARIPPAMLAARAWQALRRAARPVAAPLVRRSLAAAGARSPAMRLSPFEWFFAPGRAGAGLAPTLDLAKQQLALHEHRVALAPLADWDGAELTRLERYVLHSFRWVEELAASAPGEGGGADRAAWTDTRRLLASWLEACPPPSGGSGDAWDPWPLSLRCVAWLKLCARFRAPLGRDEALAGALARSLHTQGCHLARAVEWHLGLNHLVENGRALLFLGHAFDDARGRRWRRAGRRIVDRAVRDQFFADGCHLERSPMYHAIVLESLAECARLLEGEGLTPPAAWRDAIARAAGFLARSLHPDGGIPLVNDAALDVARAPGEILARADDGRGRGHPVRGEGAPAAGSAPRRPPRAPDSGFRIVTSPDGSFHFVADLAAPAPRFNPGHAHAGALSYELSVAGRRAVVDAGVGTYAAGDERAYCRSTAAHNTVCVDGRDQSEMWAAFRIGARATVVAARPCLPGPGTDDTPGVVSIRAVCRHAGGRAVHRRAFTIAPGKYVVVRDDVAAAPGAEVAGAVHLAPEWEVRDEGGGVFACAWGAVRFTVRVGPPWRARVEPATIWRRLGRPERTTRIVMSAPAPVHGGEYVVAL